MNQSSEILKCLDLEANGLQSAVRLRNNGGSTEAAELQASNKY